MPEFRLVVVVGVLAVCQVCLAGKVLNWKPMTIGEQAAQAEIIVYGTIRAHYPIPDIPIERFKWTYIAEMDVICVLKGEILASRINISEAGGFTSMHHTHLPVGETFITFLKRVPDSDELVPHEVNHISVAFPPTNENAYGVGQALGDLEDNCPPLHSQIKDWKPPVVAEETNDAESTSEASASVMGAVGGVGLRVLGRRVRRRVMQAVTGGRPPTSDRKDENDDGNKDNT